MKHRAIKTYGLLALVAVIVVTIGLVGALFASGLDGFSGKEALLSAFGGAFFAYIFVKLGELFTRLSQREKLNLDTLVEFEYVLNDHLNRISVNIKILEALVTVVEQKSSVINFMKTKAMPVDKSNLRNLKNLDFINDMFNYFVDLEKINDGLELVISFAIKLINDTAAMSISGRSKVDIEKSYKVNSDALIGMVNDTISLFKAAEKDCVELIAKSKYVYDRRNIWLSLAYTGGARAHYADDLKEELPKLVKELEESRDKNTETSVKKTAKALGKGR
jgi:hypothetical protein